MKLKSTSTAIHSPYLQILLCFSSNPSNLVGQVFSAEEFDLSFNSETKEHPQISNPSFWKRDRETRFSTNVLIRGEMNPLTK